MFCSKRATFVFFCSMLMAAPGYAAERFALVIGNQAYNDQVGPLRNPHHDIAVVGKSLAEVGFTLLPPRKDATRDDILFAVYELAARARAAGSDAVTFLYYAGHGVGVGGENVLVPSNAEDTSDAMLNVRGVRLGEILDILKSEAPEGVHFIVLDACRNSLRGKRGARGFIPVNDRRTGVVIAFSTAPGETATDAGTNGAPYALALAEEIVMPGRNDQAVFNAVRARVVGITRGQTPWTHDGLIGARVVFKKHAPPVAAPVMAPPAAAPSQTARLSEAAEAWDRTKDTTSTSVLAAFLRRYNDTYYADLARARMDALAKQSAAAEAAKQMLVLARDLERELARVGCDPGARDGKWDSKAAEALNDFARITKAAIPKDHPSDEALSAVRAHKGRICPLRCAADQTEVGGRCVAKAPPKTAKSRAKSPPRETVDPSARCFGQNANMVVPCDDPTARPGRLR